MLLLSNLSFNNSMKKITIKHRLKKKTWEKKKQDTGDQKEIRQSPNISILNQHDKPSDNHNKW
jgi:hypothetical protein